MHPADPPPRPSDITARVFDSLMERALNGVTTITLRTGGAVEQGHGPNRRPFADPLRRKLT